MVKVPLSSVPLRPTQTPQLSAPRVTPPNDFTGQQLQEVGQAIQSAGFRTQSAFSELQADHDYGRTQKAINSLGDAENDIGGSFYDTVGEAASGKDAVERVLGSYERRYQEIAAGLENEEQRAMFQEAYSRRLVNFRGNIFEHARKQGRIFKVAQIKAGAEQSAQAAIQAYRQHGDRSSVEGLEEDVQGPATQGSAYRLYLNTALRQQAAWADGVGRSPAQKEQDIQEIADSIHGGILDALLADDRIDEAREYAAKVGDDMSEELRSKATATLRRAGVNEEGARLALKVGDQVRADYQKELRAPGRTARMASRLSPFEYGRRAREELEQGFREGKYSVEVYKTARAQIDQDEDRMRDEKAEREKGLLEEARRYAQQGIGLENSGFPASLRLSIEDAGLAPAAEEVARAFKGDDKYVELLQDAENDLLRGMKRSEFEVKYGPWLSEPHMRQGLVLWGAANQAPEAQHVLNVDEYIADQMLLRGDVAETKKDWTVEDWKKFARIRDEVERRVSAKPGLDPVEEAKKVMAEQVLVDGERRTRALVDEGDVPLPTGEVLSISSIPGYEPKNNFTQETVFRRVGTVLDTLSLELEKRWKEDHPGVPPDISDSDRVKFFDVLGRPKDAYEYDIAISMLREAEKKFADTGERVDPYTLRSAIAERLKYARQTRREFSISEQLRRGERPDWGSTNPTIFPRGGGR